MQELFEGASVASVLCYRTAKMSHAKVEIKGTKTVKTCMELRYLTIPLFLFIVSAIWLPPLRKLCFNQYLLVCVSVGSITKTKL